MTANRARRMAFAGLAGPLLLALAGAAHADVKAGVDAWSAGDFAKAVAEWRGPAGKGDADAMFNLAQAYRLGRGVDVDLKQAEGLYARAAAKGHVKAADNYGLLLFQDGRREQAMPYVTAAAERGDPRAQYLVGIAHFNGDLVVKDWVRAYALLTLANGAGLPQAAQGLKQMDEFVPLAQRQQAQSLAAQMRQDADARRTSQLAAADLGDGATAPAVPPPPATVVAAAPAALPPARVPQRVEPVVVAPSVPVAQAAVNEAMRATGTENPAAAGADFARPAVAGAIAPPAARPPASTVAAKAPPAARPAAQPTPKPAPAPATTGGSWKLQLGAFSVAGNADRAWSQVAGKAPLAGKRKVTVSAGKLTRLLAEGWASQSAAQSACAALKTTGQACLVTR